MLLRRVRAAEPGRGDTRSEMAFDPMFRPVLEQLRDRFTVRLRTYEIRTRR